MRRGLAQRQRAIEGLKGGRLVRIAWRKIARVPASGGFPHVWNGVTADRPPARG
ncbi:hypothetical protein GRI40_01665 [Altererythrobacter aerius]|uniref:Uncharacterized protein n=1 Tax=Tsuneonella aeria TaxID=1837929 RepID=A0A6I4T9D3_9SPHN|nr:hypothetical protein [Tsuneonella aeria]MXO73931.1 hypothetical protein [Tsuneonella aeria]